VTRRENVPQRESGEGDTNKANLIPDNQQLFVGSIPVQYTEAELIKLFEPYGKVLEFRLSGAKNVSAGAGGKGGPPNYGFAMFDSPETVQKVLAVKSNSWQIGDGAPFKLNIEEKKPRGAAGNKSRGGSSGPPRDRRPTSNMNSGRRDYQPREPRSGPRNNGPSRPGGGNGVF